MARLRPRRNGASASRERRRPPPRRARGTAGRVAESGDDARVAEPRPRLPSRFARQDTRAPAGHARPCGHPADPVHDRHPRRHRRVPRRSRRRARGDRGSPSPPRPRARGHRAELPAEARHRRCTSRRRARRTSTSRSIACGPRHPAAPTSTCKRRRTCPTTSVCSSTPASTIGAACLLSPPITSTPNGRGPPSTGCATSTEAKGFVLAPRLTIYPEFVRDPASVARPRRCTSPCWTAPMPRGSDATIPAPSSPSESSS